MDDHSHEEFTRVKDKAELFYKSLGKMQCPALAADVHFSSDGFHHLRFDGTRAERSKAVQKGKLLCLEEAAEIIRKTTTVQEFRSTLAPVGKPDARGLRPTKRVEFFAFHAITDMNKPRRVNVVVRRVGDGNYHFWSVMPSWKESKINGAQTLRSVGGRWMFDS